MARVRHALWSFNLFLLTNSSPQRKKRRLYSASKRMSSITCPIGTSRLTSKTPSMNLPARAWLTALCQPDGTANGHAHPEGQSEPCFVYALLPPSLSVLAGIYRPRRIVGDSSQLPGKHRPDSVMDTGGRFTRRLHPRKTLR